MVSTECQTLNTGDGSMKEGYGTMTDGQGPPRPSTLPLPVSNIITEYYELKHYISFCFLE